MKLGERVHNMRQLGNQKGFSLAELSIVIVLMGIMIGAALQAQSLVLNAQITSTVAQVQSYTTAISTFKSLYTFLPGDLPSAGTRIPGCPGIGGVACNPTPCTPIACDASPAGVAPGAGDNMIGQPLWSAAWGAPGITSTTGTVAPNNIDAERYLFWAHLVLTNLISGVNVDGLSAVTKFQNARTNPAAASGGGFIVGYATGIIGPGSTQPAGTGVTGNILAQVIDPTLALQTTSGKLPLSPAFARQIDTKMDDGFPATGYVQAYGVAASCFTAPATLLYNERIVGGHDCGLLYRLGL